jgi:hypothetical protein
MPRYLFNMCSGGQKNRDPEGQCFPDLEAARAEAVEGAREIAADRLRFGQPVNLGDYFEITNEAGQPLLTVRFSEAITIIGRVK